MKRFREHQQSSSGVGAKLGQVATSAFRGTVLPFSTKWMFGNVAEAALRLTAAGVTPGDVVRGRRVMGELRKLDDQAWKEADTRIRGGLLYGSADRLSVHRGAEDFEGTWFEHPAKTVAGVGRLPVVKQIVGGLQVYQRSVFALNRGLERAEQTGVIGKQARREAQEITGSWGRAVRMQRQIAQEVAQGLLGTPKQVQFARVADELLGKYSRFSPSTRKVIQTYAPFLPWFLNAGRFVLYTLPAKHPAKTALLTSIETTLQEDIERHRGTVPPGDLEAAIRTKDGGLVNLARYTPFGAFTKGVEGIAEPLLPQIDSAVGILQGRSFTGRELRQQSGEPVPNSKRLWLAMYALLEGAAPGISIARRLQERGESPFDDSTVFAPRSKPGTSYGSSAPRRVFDPLRPTYLQAPAQTKAAGPVDRETQRLLNRAKRVQGSQPSGAELERLVRRARRAQAVAQP